MSHFATSPFYVIRCRPHWVLHAPELWFFTQTALRTTRGALKHPDTQLTEIPCGQDPGISNFQTPR